MKQGKPPAYLIEAMAFMHAVIKAASELEDPKARKFVLDCLYEAQITMAKKKLS